MFYHYIEEILCNDELILLLLFPSRVNAGWERDIVDLVTEDLSK